MEVGQGQNWGCSTKRKKERRKKKEVGLEVNTENYKISVAVSVMKTYV
jgi:hypothetical protein